jgi:exopolysaccharide biosynthesis polyprenyl glycosylphosphotransferase
VSSSPATRSAIHRPPPPARLIPGARSSPATVGRKKPHSVSLDGSYWAADHFENALPRHDPKPLQLLSQAVLPAPAVRGHQRHLAAWVATDFLCITITSALVRALSPSAGPHLVFAPITLGLLFMQGALLTLLAFSEGLYRSDLTWSPAEQRVVLGKVIGLSTLLLATANYLSGSGILALVTLSASAPLNYAFMSGCRAWHRLTALHAHNRTTKNVLIVGSGPLAHQLASHMDGSANVGRLFRGFLTEETSLGTDIRGTIHDLATIARREFIDEIILVDTRDPALARWVIREAQRNRLDIKMVPDLFGFKPREISVEDVSSVPVLTLSEESIPIVGLRLKRLLDLAGSAAALLVCAPLLAAIALLIKQDSPGTILYGAPRIGRKGVRFRCFKFRTMVQQADALKDNLRANNQREGPFFKITDDPRITRVGRLLRRYSLDELPQLWNVLLGDMSLVGPRPHPLDDCAHYDLDHLRRLDVTPGITGLWQVTARRDPSFDRNMALDLEYIEKWSLALDLRILLKTFSVVLRGTGA